MTNLLRPIYGAGPLMKPLPKQSAEVIRLHIDRYDRASLAMQQWSQTAKKAVQYFEGEQWSEADLRELQAQGRPALTLNKIKRLVRLVHGYMLTNRTSIGYKPGHDGTGRMEIAGALSHMSESTSQISDLPACDDRVIMDALQTGRGWYDGRLYFDENDFGDLRWTVDDPFSIYVDPECTTYDINESAAFVMQTRWISLDEIDLTWGRQAYELLQPLAFGGGFQGLPTGAYNSANEEITPWRTFGGEQDDVWREWNNWSQMFFDWFDTARKTVKMLDIQHYIPCWRRYFVDLETGEKSAIPDHWTGEKIEKVLGFAAAMGDRVTMVMRRENRVRWTQIVGDLIVYDEWSPYRRFTKVPFFPYFRRGKTQGMVEDLFDAQDEINKRRSNQINILGRAAAGGWSFPNGMLDAMQKLNLKKYGSAPGVMIEWNSQNGKFNAGPQQIEAGTTPVAYQQMEEKANKDLTDISGVNEAALGTVDKVMSGRAVEARQRQAVVGLEGFDANYKLTKRVQGRLQLDAYQDHYTEERVIVVIGAGNNPVETQINQRTAAGIVNEVGLGTYFTVTDDKPISKTFQEGEFEELIRLKSEVGMPIPDDFLIDASSVRRKDEFKLRVAELRKLEQAAAAQQAMAAGAGQPGSGQAPGSGAPGPAGSGGPPPAQMPPEGAVQDAAE